MKTVFWGFFLILLNFNLSFNSHVLNLLPDFAGYLLLYRAGEALAEENRRFGQLRPFEMGMAVYTGLLWVGDLLGVTSSGPVSTLLGLAAAVVALLISWNVVQAILEMEAARGADLNGASVRKAWFVLLAAQILAYAAVLLLSAGLGLLVGIAGLVGIIWFLAALWRCAKCWEGLRPAGGGPEIL